MKTAKWKSKFHQGAAKSNERNTDEKGLGISGLKITAGQRSLSGQTDNLPEEIFGWAVIFDGGPVQEKQEKIFLANLEWTVKYLMH